MDVSLVLVGTVVVMDGGSVGVVVVGGSVGVVVVGGSVDVAVVGCEVVTGGSGSRRANSNKTNGRSEGLIRANGTI